MPFDLLGPEVDPVPDPGWPHRSHPEAGLAKTIPEGFSGDDLGARVQGGTIESGRRAAKIVARGLGWDDLCQSAKPSAAAYSMRSWSRRDHRIGISPGERDGAASCAGRVRVPVARDLVGAEVSPAIAWCHAVRCERRGDQFHSRQDADAVRRAPDENTSAGVRELALSDSTLGFAPNGWGRRASNRLCIDRSTVLTLSSMHSHGYC
jgi:hypothetical protein